ncbi:aldehyde dehydrogenase (NADP(+)) [Pedobacter panaciterrae]|uniref:Aldehyde dehydrogenase (NADP(+)) n=1 Tax=Pedobacter panaciterrae TaxID=363849 RepID=A0ABU8NLE0_9SPHI
MNGRSIIASQYSKRTAKVFYASNPASGELLKEEFFNAVVEDLNEAMTAATEAHYKQLPKSIRVAFLRSIAEELEFIGEELVARAQLESGLTKVRLTGELARTTGQLRLFADQVEEGSWLNAIIDTAIPDRQPIPKPDIRRMLVPLGPVVVFGASNFPLAFSVAGGDTASAFAAGCPVIVKAHAAHPGTSALAGQAIMRALHKSGVHHGFFSMLFDEGYEIGEMLVKHSETRAVTFTGSYQGGMALLKMVQQRKNPIPFFAEMGSINPIFLLPQALKSRAGQIASTYAGSITMGAGQFCTNPGLLIAVKSKELDIFIEHLKIEIERVASATMLTVGIYNNYKKRTTEVLKQPNTEVLAASLVLNADASCQALSIVSTISGNEFLQNPVLQEEIFGPYSMLVIADDTRQLTDIADILQGQLTITMMAEPSELAEYHLLIEKLKDKTGRLILNNPPTGVEVCAAMQHGGPFPATNDSRFTSVGSTAVLRFCRPLAWQNWPDEMLPDELKEKNPLNIFRLINNKWTK